MQSILNYAPIVSRVPAGVYLKQIDPVLELQSMTYHLKRLQDQGGQDALSSGRA